MDRDRERDHERGRNRGRDGERDQAGDRGSDGVHRVVGERELAALNVDLARSLLREMVRARVFDERAFALQRQGWMSGYPPFRGGEATQVGAAAAMADGDWLAPTYRSNALQLALGVPMADLLRFRRGYPEFGPDGERWEEGDGEGWDEGDGERRILPQAVPIATQIPHAVGLGMAAGYGGTDEAVVCCFGDGATSEGDFHEGLNFAGVFEAPVVFLCENNGWAISTPTERQTASRTVAQKADAYGIEGVRVDGTDPLAVYEIVTASLRSARAGRPVLVESLTYRHGPHTTADDPGRYEHRADFPEWRLRDPVERFADYLETGEVVDGSFVEEVREAAEDAFDDARAAAEAAAPDPEELFEPVYEALPPHLEAQREELRAWLERHGDPYDREQA